ncbi:hypothetical protein [Thorsellia anophelis]|uniref:Uncharacterized protein n=1 Tax=Thorsellia anophelis DSM 18579 TaxID=1123402 RepID=A0A1H9ZZW4_9GAMM|nr:hypothetical protein [Thorsellia anophelis]SES87336.1 hypothetical protein SAMN02583745_00784 [Thorsellia anophelis DSM 18579]
MKNEKFIEQKNKSLTQFFESPDDYEGHFGWVCGYSADDSFMDLAVERFTGANRGQRALAGQIKLGLLLDQTNQPLKISNMPGVMHFLVKNSLPKYKLMHAKVAILGFRSLVAKNDWKIRLLVSTGNWTKQTLEQSLDLIWQIEINQNDLVSKDKDKIQGAADIKAAWDFMSDLLENYNLEALSPLISSNLSIDLMKWLELTSKAAKGKPRFIDNRKKSFFNQLGNHISSFDCAVSRNFLAIGSGFFEETIKKYFTETVVSQIEYSLKENGLLTKTPYKVIYVNPLACQSIAQLRKEIEENNYKIHPAYINPNIYGENTQRTLHAKFIFSAKYSTKTDKYSHGWLYLGSGNITNPGFMNTAASKKGNLEAGVIFETGDIWGNHDDKSPKYESINYVLPIHRTGKEPNHENIDLIEGKGFEDSDKCYAASEISYVIWNDESEPVELYVSDSEKKFLTNYCLFNGDKECKRSRNGFIWESEKPREVLIKWKIDTRNYEVFIPVIGEDGRIAGAKLPQLTPEEAELQLLSFPNFLDDEALPVHQDGEEDEQDTLSEIIANNDLSRTSQKKSISSYQVRQMMSLIEKIAVQQTQMAEQNWTLWCNRLAQTLIQMKSTCCVLYFKESLKINPLSALYREEFKPDFANNGNEYADKYIAAIKKIESEWGVGKLTNLDIGEVL